MIVVATQDRRGAGSRARRVAGEQSGKELGLPFYRISAVTGQGLDELVGAMAARALAPVEQPGSAELAEP